MKLIMSLSSFACGTRLCNHVTLLASLAYFFMGSVPSYELIYVA